jgi:hypothetical protein
MGASGSVPSQKKLQSIIFLKLFNKSSGGTVRQKLQEAFDETDTSGDGQISRDEFADVVAKLGFEIAAEKAELVFNNFDLDNNGYIEREEFLKFMGIATGDELHTGMGMSKQLAVRGSIEEGEFSAMSMKDQRMHEVEISPLRVECFCQDESGEPKFEGQAGVDQDTLAALPGCAVKLTQTLRPKPKSGRDDIRGEISVRLHRQKVVKLRIMEARGVKKADLFGKSDPYCVVHWRGREIFRTEVMNKTLDPKWEDGEAIELVMPVKPASAQLVLSVWDNDKGSTDDFLGQVAFTGDELMKLDENMAYEGHALAERPEGSKVGARGQLFTMLQREERLCVELVGVDGVAKQTKKGTEEGSKNTDAMFCHVYWNQLKVDDTKVCTVAAASCRTSSI